MGTILPSVPPDDLLAEYIETAMRNAVYEILEDDGSCFGTVPGFQGAWANADTVEECRKELAEVLEDWIVLGIEHGHEIPVLPSIALHPNRSFPVSKQLSESGLSELKD